MHIHIYNICINPTCSGKSSQVIKIRFLDFYTTIGAEFNGEINHVLLNC